MPWASVSYEEEAFEFGRAFCVEDDAFERLVEIARSSADRTNRIPPLSRLIHF